MTGIATQPCDYMTLWIPTAHLHAAISAHTINYACWIIIAHMLIISVVRRWLCVASIKIHVERRSVDKRPVFVHFCRHSAERWHWEHLLSALSCWRGCGCSSAMCTSKSLNHRPSTEDASSAGASRLLAIIKGSLCPLFVPCHYLLCL